MSDLDKGHHTPEPSEKKAKKSEEFEQESSPAVAAAGFPEEYDCFLMEEEESKAYTSEEIRDSFMKICGDVKDALQKMLKVKLEKSDKKEKGVDLLDIASYYMELIELNRLDKHCMKRSRDALNEKKQKLDHLNFQIQNLQCEASYLQNAVINGTENCPKEEDVELLPLDDFLKENPQHIIKPDMTSQEKQELTIKRLRWELDVRKSLSVKLKEAERKKHESEAEIKLLRERLNSIIPILDDIIEAVTSVPQLCKFPMQEMYPQNRNASLLPNALYCLYVQMLSYHEFKSKLVKVSICRNKSNITASEPESDNSVEGSGESDRDDGAKTSHEDSTSTSKTKNPYLVTSIHPYSVVLTVAYEKHEVQLKFDYLPQQSLVTVYVMKLGISSPFLTNIEAEKILCLETFFDNLLPNIDGQLRCKLSFHSQFLNSEERVGKPYIWCQKIADVEVLPFGTANSVEMGRKKAEFVMNTVSAIRSRFKTRVLLSFEITTLVNRHKLRPHLADVCANKVSSQLKKFTNVSWNRVQVHPNIKEYLDLNVITKESIVFEAIIERGSAKLTALIVITGDYPENSPLFMLFLRWKGQHNSVTNNSIRDMEEEINCHFVNEFPEEHRDNLLVCQMHHLQACLDIYVETEHFNDLIEGPLEFIKEKAITNDFRSRARHRPYRYFPSNKIFDQRYT